MDVVSRVGARIESGAAENASHGVHGALKTGIDKF